MYQRERIPWQVWPILAIWLGIYPLILGETFASSANYAEVFFYSDVSVAQGIIESGYVHRPEMDMTYWRKVGARVRQPILPIYLSYGTLITDLPMFVFQRQLPLYPIVIGSYYLVMREFAGKKVSGFLAISGAIAPNFNAATAYVMGPMVIVPFLLTIWILIRHTKATQHSKLLCVTCLPLLHLNLIYSYPRMFGLAALVAIIVVLVHIMVNNNIMIGPLTGVFAGGWILLTQGFVSYQNVLIGITYNLIRNPYSILSAATGTGGPVAPLSVPSVSLITIPILVPLGLVGGVVVIRRVVKSQTSSGKIQCGEAVLFGWGVALVIFAVLHILVGKFWLVLRLYGTAVPLILVASAIGISYLRNTRCICLNGGPHMNMETAGSLAIVAVIAILMISFGWIATAANTDIHTYQEEDAEAAEWTRYANGPVASDMSLGSHIVLHQNAVYPRTSQGVNELFYSTPPTYQWPSSAPDAHLFMISNEWADTGFYIPPSARQPVTRSWLNSTRRSGDVVYSSGRISSIAL